MKLYKLKDGDEVTVVRILKWVFQYWMKSDKFMFADNDNNEIKRELFEYHNEISFIQKYYAIIIVNGRYELIAYGKHLNDIFEENNDYNIIIEQISAFLSYDKTYLLRNNLKTEYDNDKILDLVSVYNEIKRDLAWDSEKNFEKIYNFFKSKGKTKLQQFKNPLRLLKLERLLDTETEDLFEILETYSEENNLTEEQEEILLKGGELIYEELKKVLEK